MTLEQFILRFRDELQAFANSRSIDVCTPGQVLDRVIRALEKVLLEAPAGHAQLVVSPWLYAELKRRGYDMTGYVINENLHEGGG